MNTRLSLKEIRDQIAATTLLPSITRFGTSFDRDFVETIKAASPLPQVWVIGQSLTSKDDGMGYPGLARGTEKIEVVIRALYQRYDDGNTGGEALCQLIHNAVFAQLTGWTPTGANRPLVWTAEKDGLATESVPSLDMKFVTEVDFVVPLF